MYLTRFEINAARRGARDLLASPHRLHAAVLAAFPTAQREPTRGSDGGRILWRVDQRGHQTLLYLVSPHQPDLTHLVETAGWPATHTWDTRPYTPLLDRLTPGGHMGVPAHRQPRPQPPQDRHRATVPTVRRTSPPPNRRPGCSTAPDATASPSPDATRQGTRRRRPRTPNMAVHPRRTRPSH